MKDLEKLKYAELKALAKQFGVNPNQKKSVLVELISEQYGNPINSTDVDAIMDTAYDERFVTQPAAAHNNNMNIDAKMGPDQFSKIVKEHVLLRAMVSCDMRKLYSEYIKSEVGGNTQDVINFAIKQVL